MRGNQVMQLDLNGELVKIWDSMLQAEQEGNFYQSCISYVCMGKRETHKGFKWKLLKDFEEENEYEQV